MTLILSAATEKLVMQVSDRRLTLCNPNGSVRSFDDESNNAALYCGGTAIAYTGLGDLDGLATDWWILEELAPARNLDDVSRILAERGAEAIAALPRTVPSWARKHTFVMAGWAQFESGQSLASYITKISNFETFEESLPEAADEFTVSVMRRPDEDIALFVDAGAEMLESERNWCLQELAHHPENKDRGAEDLFEILAGGIRTVAKRDRRVGRGLLATSLPLKGLLANRREGFYGATAQTISDEIVTTFNLNPDDSTANFESPHMVCDGTLLGGQITSTSKEQVMRRTERRHKRRSQGRS